MKRVAAMLSVMVVMVAMLATPAFAGPRYVGFNIVCPDGTTVIEADPIINREQPGYFGKINRQLAQQYQGCEITRYTTPATS
jgi:hypothetical protein